MNILLRRGVIALLLLVFAGTAPAEAAWRRAESPNFIVYSSGSEADLRERVQRLEDFDHLLRILTGVTDSPAPNKLRITLVNNHRDLITVLPVGAGIDGFYVASANGIGAVVDRGPAGDNQILFHEYAHHFMSQYRPNAYPAWYVEGFAEYFMTVGYTSQAINIGLPSDGRVYSISSGAWLPTEQLLTVNPQSLDQQDMEMFYAQSWLTVHYFYSNPERQAALGRFLVAARSMAPAAALERATGMTPDRFGRELHTYIRGGRITYRRMGRGSLDSPASVAITILPDSANDLMNYDAALRIGIDDSRIAPVLSQIRSVAARYADDSYAMRVQAYAEALYGDGAVAERLLDRLLVASPHDAELMFLKGMCHLRASEQDHAPAGEAAAARPWFNRAHREDQYHWQTLYRYVESLHGESSFASENTSNVLLLAHRLAPQVAEISMNAATLLMTRGEFADAAVLLRPLAADPHHEGLARAARQLLERAEAGGRPDDRAPAATAPVEPRTEGQ